jgi:TolB-like protein
MSTAENKAVFLSYASQDAEAARALAEALRTAGVEVRFDQAELAGGDAWDQKIRGQIKNCALFVPVISAATQARREGYFRLEWKLAAQRTHTMADGTPFLLPVVIDDTRDAEALVPAEFKAVQWTRLPDGEGGERFSARVQRLLAAGPEVAKKHAPSTAPEAVTLPARKRVSRAGRWWIGLVLLGAAGGLVLAWRFAGTSLGRADRALSAQMGAQAPETEAEKWVRQAKALIDDDPLLVRENYRAASELCRRALALSPDNAEAWATLSRANLILFASYHEGGEPLREEARQQAERAMRLAPDSPDAQLAMERYEYQQPSGADNSPARLEALWTRFPRDQRIARRLANVSYLLRNREATKLWAERADSLPGGDPIALAQIGWEAWSSGRLEEVAPALERALGRGPSSSALHLELIYRNGMGDLEGVRSAFDRMPTAVRREDRIVALVVQTHLNTRAPEKALEALRLSSREFLEEGRQFIPRGFLAGEALSMLGKTRAAEVEFRAALKAVEARLTDRPRDARLVLWRASLLLSLGQKEEAARQYETAVELGQRPDPALLVLLGRPQEAVAEIDLRVNRANLGWSEFLQSLRNPVFDPLRTNSRFTEIVRRGEGWLTEIRRAGAAGRMPSAAEPATDDKSLAVLPFANLSGDPAQEYFSDGLTEEILNTLARERDLRVIARTSAFSFKGKNASVAEIARALGVARLVEGSVRKSGSKVRISVSLTRAADGFSEELGTFTEELTDVFALQDKVASAVLAKLTTRTAIVVRTAVPTLNPAAYDAYLRGRALAVSGAREKAITLYREAVTLAPDFALAWASMAEAALVNYRLGRDNSPARLALLQESLARAQALQPQSPEVLYVSALFAADLDVDLTKAKRLLEQARSAGLEDIRWSGGQLSLANLEPSLPARTALYGQHGDTLLRLDPQNPYWANQYGNFSRNIGAYAKAESLFLHALRVADPVDYSGLSNLIDNRSRWRGPASALALLEKIAPAQPASPALRGRLLHWLGRDEEARLAFTQALARPHSILTESTHWSEGGWLDLGEAMGQAPPEIAATQATQQARYNAGDHATILLSNLAQLEFLLGHRDRAKALLEERAKFMQEAKQGVNYNTRGPLLVRLSGLYASMGDSAEAMKLLAEAWSAGALPNLELRWNPRFASLRDDPRFQAWVRQAEQHAASLPDPVDP